MIRLPRTLLPVSLSAAGLRTLLLPVALLLCVLPLCALLPATRASGAGPPPPVGEAPLAARCITALDGDSLVVDLNGRRMQVRLLGVDCPEKGQPFADAARDLSRSFCAGQDVTLAPGPRRFDRYGRLLAYVRSGRRLLNEELVRAGLALAETWDEGEPLAEALEQAEAEARNAGAGFWAVGGLEMTPRQWRNSRRRPGQ